VLLTLVVTVHLATAVQLAAVLAGAILVAAAMALLAKVIFSPNDKPSKRLTRMLHELFGRKR